MKFLLHHETQPALNLALEEYLFNQKEDYFILWRNEPCVVVGKHQNVLAETDHSFLLQNNIPVYRRISGGGTVYHDLGNINFSVILTRPKEKLVDFKRYMTPIFNALQSMGLNVEYSDRNDIYLEGKKISGNAEHAVRNRVLHHGTLLYDANLDNLRNSLQDHRDKFKGRSVPSVPASVRNIKPLLDNAGNTESFLVELYDSLTRTVSSNSLTSMQVLNNDSINELCRDKYQTIKWNLGYGPKYEYVGSTIWNDSELQLRISVKEGLIVELNFEGPWPSHLKEITSSSLIGQYHFPSEIEKSLKFQIDGKLNVDEHQLLMSLCFEL